MDKFLLQAFQNLPDAQLPAGLHAAAVRAVAFRRYRKYAVWLMCLVTVTFIFSLWHVYTRLVEADALSVVKAVVGTFELSFDSITDSIETLVRFLPVQSLILLTLNFVTFVFMFFLLRSFSRLQNRFTLS